MTEPQHAHRVVVTSSAAALDTGTAGTSITRKRRRAVNSDSLAPLLESSEPIIAANVEQPDVERVHVAEIEDEEDIAVSVMEINRCYRDHVNAFRSRAACRMLSDAEYSDFDKSDGDDLPDLLPFTTVQLEQMWENAPPCRTVQMFQDVQTESGQSGSFDLTHFTPNQVASLWSATMQMQREAYNIYRSQHKQQSQQEQSQLSEAESVSPAFTQPSPAQSSDSRDESIQLTAPPLTTGPPQLLFSQTHVPELLSVTPLTSPRDSSSANGQSLVSTSSRAPYTSSRQHILKVYQEIAHCTISIFMRS